MNCVSHHGCQPHRNTVRLLAIKLGSDVAGDGSLVPAAEVITVALVIVVLGPLQHRSRVQRDLCNFIIVRRQSILLAAVEKAEELCRLIFQTYRNRTGTVIEIIGTGLGGSTGILQNVGITVVAAVRGAAVIVIDVVVHHNALAPDQFVDQVVEILFAGLGDPAGIVGRVLAVGDAQLVRGKRCRPLIAGFLTIKIGYTEVEAAGVVRSGCDSTRLINPVSTGFDPGLGIVCVFLLRQERFGPVGIAIPIPVFLGHGIGIAVTIIIPAVIRISGGADIDIPAPAEGSIGIPFRDGHPLSLSPVSFLVIVIAPGFVQRIILEGDNILVIAVGNGSLIPFGLCIPGLVAIGHIIAVIAARLAAFLADHFLVRDDTVGFACFFHSIAVVVTLIFPLIPVACFCQRVSAYSDRSVSINGYSRTVRLVAFGHVARIVAEIPGLGHRVGSVGDGTALSIGVGNGPNIGVGR